MLRLIELRRFALALRALVARRRRRMSKSARDRLRLDFRRVTGIAADARARKRERNYAVLLEAKDRPCADCGEFFGARRMEFDHVPERGPKVDSPCRLIERSRAQVLREIAKCDVVC